MSGVQSLVLRFLGDGLGKRKVVFLVALIVTSLVVTGFVWARKDVVIIADGKTYSVNTFRNGPVEVLAQAAVYLGPKDEFRMSTPNLINGTTIEVYRAVPVTVKFQSKTEIVTTGKPTVGELAESLGFTAENSRTIPDAKTRITKGMQIVILKVTEKTVTQVLPVKPQVLRQPDANMEKGMEEVVQQGVDGLKEAQVKLRFEDGNQVAANILNEKILKQSTPQIIRVGMRDTVNTSRGAMRFKRILWMQATAYTPNDGWSSGVTATGMYARRGIAAVDPSVIPLGSRLYIPGYGLALAADTGGAIVGNRIDLCVGSRSEAMSIGRRTVKVYVID